MASQPNILSMFPKLRRIGRMPTAAERVAYWESSRLQRIYAAVNACEWAYSHRQEAFHTDGLPRHPLHPANMARYGCSALGCRLGLTEEDRFVITTGANFKLRSGDGDLIQFHPKFNFKLCSEPESVINAISYPVKCWKVHGITLYSNNMQKEDVSGIFCRIQQPCADCREFLSNFLFACSPVTLVRDALPCELNTAMDLVEGPNGRMLVVEDWTFGMICALHQRMRGRRSAA